jgi:hypothetical protein
VSTAARPAPAVAATTPRHRAPLRVVAGDRPSARASSGAFAVFVGAVLGIGLLGLLLLNTLLAQGSFTTSDLQNQQTALDTTAQALQQQVAVLESPQVLAHSAVLLGMVVTRNPVFLDPVTGRIWGVPQAGAHPARVANNLPGTLGAPGARVGTVQAPAPPAAVTPATKPTTKPTTRPTTKPTTKPTGTAKPPSPKPTPPPKPGSHR